MAEDTARLTEFLKPLDIDLEKVVQLAKKLEGCYRGLARESHNQFLPTPISDRVLRPNSNAGGRYVQALNAKYLQCFGDKDSGWAGAQCTSFVA